MVVLVITTMRRHFNGVKTAALFAAFWALLWFFGSVISGGSYLWLFVLFGIGTSGYSYWNSGKLAIRAMRARPLARSEAPEVYTIVSELAQSAGQPMPELYISPTTAPNAFATGRNPANAKVCVTTGIMDLLTTRELRGVLGHELMHVYNRDILISSVAGALAGIITSVAQMSLFFSHGRDDRGPNPLVALLMAFLAPLAASVIQLAISRTREFDADEDGANLTGDPLALASALEKISAGAQAAPLKPEPNVVNASHAFIASPFRVRDMSRLFSTHPPTAERVRRLEEMAHSQR